jgi:hypothetical protein
MCFEMNRWQIETLELLAGQEYAAQRFESRDAKKCASPNGRNTAI